MSSAHDPRYRKLVQKLVEIRNELGMTQEQLAERMGLKYQSTVSKVENYEKLLDIIELIDWVGALKYDLDLLLKQLELVSSTSTQDINETITAPQKGAEYVIKSISDQEYFEGTEITLTNNIDEKRIMLNGITPAQLNTAVDLIVPLFRGLNVKKPSLMNREAIARALELAFDNMPHLNPSDIYHHLVYRLYLREYTNSNNKQSWVRAGGEGLELFLENHYNNILGPVGIKVKWLNTAVKKDTALRELGIKGLVGDSKLDMALYTSDGDQEIIFGGMHVKASLAERVTDDVPCSEAMMKKGYSSILFTFDAKSYPEKDLVNRGEFGSVEVPSNKRKYVEELGQFSACFSYNSRTVPSPDSTLSGRRIFVSKFGPEDSLPKYIIEVRDEFISRR